MEALLFADGTCWEAAPPPRGPRPTALELLHALVGIQVGGYKWVGERWVG